MHMHACIHTSIKYYIHTFYTIIQIFKDKGVVNELKRTLCNLYFNQVEVTVLLVLGKG